VRIQFVGWVTAIGQLEVEYLPARRYYQLKDRISLYLIGANVLSSLICSRLSTKSLAKMLYVFHVDTGTMLTFDMNVAMQRYDVFE
jgi:hypothetical protein